MNAPTPTNGHRICCRGGCKFLVGVGVFRLCIVHRIPQVNSEGKGHVALHQAVLDGCVSRNPVDHLECLNHGGKNIAMPSAQKTSFRTGDIAHGVREEG